MASEQEILKELQELNSPLATYSRAMPYALPAGYFKDVEQQLIATVTNTTHGSSTAMPFALPAEYFEKLPGQLLQAAKSSAVQEPVKKAGNRRIWLGARWAAAAMLVVAIGLSTFRMFTPEPTIEQQLDEIPYNDILAYVQDNIDEYETDNMINYLGDDAVTLPAGSVNTDAIEYYLQHGE